MSELRRSPLVAGNWKMFGSSEHVAQVKLLIRRLRAKPPACDVAICPPATLLSELKRLRKDGKWALGGQTCHSAAQGAFTGDISAEMLAAAGASLVIVGHSERRAGHGETDDKVCAQVQAAWRAGLEPILCIGETLAENETGRTQDVLRRQLAGSIPPPTHAPNQNLTIAYEPVWAIGTGRTPSLSDIQDLHAMIKSALLERFGATAALVRVLYGGSVKPENAKAILALPNVDGALVGGASLKADDFFAIISCYLEYEGVGKR